MTKKPSKSDKLFLNLASVTEQFILGRGYRPQTEERLRVKLAIPEQHNPIFSEVLQHLVSKGILEKREERYFPKGESGDILTGVIRVNRRGFGFVEVQRPSPFEQDVFIPKSVILGAVDGDKVEIVVDPSSFTEKGPEGRVITILERGRTHIGGTIESIQRGEIRVFVPLFGKEGKTVIEDTGGTEIKVGDRVVLEVLEWGEKGGETKCRLANVIGHISDPSCDVLAAVEEFGLRDRFPMPVIDEATQFATKVLPKEMADRLDLREQLCFTIDPDTAKDFDDAVSVAKDKKGHYQVWVHIADVTHYVKPGSEIDREAIARCNSTYFPGAVLPMLPEELSNNLCSLKPNVNRLACSVYIELDSQGNKLNYEVHRTVIKSSKRFTYKEAMAVIDGKKESPFKKELDLMVELCGHLKKRRYERGSIEFSLPELVVLVDDKGVPTGTDYVTYDVTHQMIEEMMLLANETVAKHLSDLKKHLAYRVHDEPADENLRDFSLLAQAFGHPLPDVPKMQDLQTLFDEAQSASYGPYLATSFIRRLRMATYSADNIGHYGLALTHYCHFTSPIRRYADIIVHRVLFGEEVEYEEIQEASEKVSHQERVSAKAENTVVMLKKLRLLSHLIKDDPHREFQAVVTKIIPFGFFFEIIDLMIEGFIHISELSNDYFDFREAEMKLIGRRTGEVYQPSQQVTVHLREIDLITQETSWYLGGESFTPRDGERQKKQSRKFTERPQRREKKDTKGKWDKKQKRGNKRRK